LVGALVVRARGGDDALLTADPMVQGRALGPVQVEIEQATGSFVLFANGVFNVYFMVKVDGGAEWRVSEDDGKPLESNGGEQSQLGDLQGDSRSR
jgi:hypothetical protein